MRSQFKLSLAAAAFCASALATTAHAEAVDIRVIGKITPAACVPTLTGGGVVDYGNIAASTLMMGSYNKLPVKDVPFSITCVAPTRIAVTATDNRASSRIAGLLTTGASGVGIADSGNFGLGKAGAANIGGYGIRFLQGSFTIDGQATNTTNNSADAAMRLSGAVPHEAGTMTWWTTPADTGPNTFTNASGTLQVEAVLNRGDELPLGSQIDLDGSATLELLYL